MLEKETIDSFTSFLYLWPSTAFSFSHVQLPILYFSQRAEARTKPIQVQQHKNQQDMTTEQTILLVRPRSLLYSNKVVTKII